MSPDERRTTMASCHSDSFSPLKARSFQKDALEISYS